MKKTKRFYWLINKKNKVKGLIQAKDSSEALKLVDPKIGIKFACKCDFNFVPKVAYVFFSSPFMFYDDKKKKRSNRKK